MTLPGIVPAVMLWKAGAFHPDALALGAQEVAFTFPRSKGPMANDVVGCSSWTAPFSYHYYSIGGEKPIREAVEYCEKMVRNSVANPAASKSRPCQPTCHTNLGL